MRSRYSKSRIGRSPSPNQYAGNPPLLSRAIQSVQSRQIHRQHFTVQEQHGAECLGVRAANPVAHWSACSETSPTLRHPGRADDASHRPATSMPTDEKPHPIRIGRVRLEATVQIPDALPKLVQESDGSKRRRAGFLERFILVWKYRFKRSSR